MAARFRGSALDSSPPPGPTEAASAHALESSVSSASTSDSMDPTLPILRCDAATGSGSVRAIVLAARALVGLSPTNRDDNLG